MANLKYIGKNILNHDLILKKGNVSGSAFSTGSFGNLNISSDASVTGDMVVGGKLTAQEIHTEIESASIIFTSGSTKFGDTSDDTHEFTGSILVKGNLTAENLTADSSSFSTRTTTLEAASASFSTRITTAETELENTLISGSAQLASQISGAFTDGFEFDGTISGSATSTASFGNLTVDGDSTVDGDLIVSQYIKHKGDTNTLINFTDNHIRFNVGGINFASLEKDASAPYPLTINNGGNRVNFRVVDQNTDLLLKTDSDANNVKLYHAGNQKLETKSTGVDVTGSLDITGSLTTIGNISGSSTSTGSFGAGFIDNRLGIGTTSPISPLHTQVSSVSYNHSYAYTGNGITMEAAEPMIQIIGNDTNTHGGSMLMRYGDNVFATITNTTADDLEFSYAVTSGNGFTMHNGGTQVTSFKKIMALNKGGNITIGGNISGSSTSTGSFGLVLQNGSELSTFLGDRGTETLFSGSAASTGSFGHLNISGPGDNVANFQAGNRTLSLKLNDSPPSGDVGVQFRAGASDFLGLAAGGGVDHGIVIDNTNNVGIGKNNPTVKLDVDGAIKASGDITANGNIVGDNATNISGVNDITALGDVSGSATSTASFGHFIGDGSGLENVFEGTAPSASISTRLTNLKTDSGSFSTRVTNLKTDSGSFSTRITTNSSSFATRITADSSSFAARDTLSEATSSKILNGELEFTNITGSGHISMSLSSTGSFGRVSVTTLGGHSPIVIDANTTFIHSITSSAHVSSSMTSTASFGRVNVVALGGHQSLTIDPITTFTNVITASSAVQFDGKIFIETGSIEGDLHVRTNENLMRIGKSTSGLIVSGSEQVSRFATGSDGSIIDLGFTAVDEDGNVVLAGDGDGIHIDSNNYWYNNKYYKIGDGVDKFLTFDNLDLKYKGQVFASTGSFDGEMFINSPTGSMFIGKFTGGIPSSGSDNVSRFATGSDGSIIDLGFTTTNEEGETVFLTTGDGVVVDSNNYWYTTGHFKIGDGQKQIEWNTTDLNISASTVDVTTLKASDVNFSNLPTSDPLVTGSLWVSGSSSSGSYKSGFVMISGMHG